MSETDLATVKAKVKAWEKKFRATNSRVPTKQDIKQDPSDIADLYALYRRLSKSQSQSQSQSQSHKGKGPLRPIPTSSSPSRPTPGRDLSTTPKNALLGTAGPTTPTPPARRHSTQGSSVSFVRTLEVEAGPSRASAAPITPQKRTQLFTTPKKQKEGYTGPIHDPLPNPFSVTPRKNRPAEHFESPFIHATSPRKLKEVLEVNSLRAMRDRAATNASATKPAAITPRTKARKRLAGEEVEGTPAKVPRRRRGDRPAMTGAAPILGAGPSFSAMEDSEDEFDQTPIKPGAAVFAFTEDIKPSASKSNGNGTTKRSPPTALFPIFQRAKRASTASHADSGRVKRRNVTASEDEDDQDPPGSPTPSTSAFPPVANGNTAPVSSFSSVSNVPSDSGDYLSHSPDDRPGDPSPAKRTPREVRTRIVTLSGDEWDPEADTRTIRVVGTRRSAVRVAPAAGIASDDELDGNQDEDVWAPGDDEDEDEDGEGVVVTEMSATMLSYLSLRSPVARSGERLADLRVRALLDPTSAAASAFRAAKRGQDVFVCGEIDGEGDEWDMQVKPVVDEGDDDWESDAEGWKATPAEEDW